MPFFCGFHGIPLRGINSTMCSLQKKAIFTLFFHYVYEKRGAKEDFRIHFLNFLK